MQPEKIWVEQCDATANIQTNFGIQPALHYLVGEKFLDFLDAAQSNEDFQAEVPQFVERIRLIFSQDQLAGYLIPSAHGTRDVLLIGISREWLLGDLDD